jgi:hypothetical protein
MDVPSVIRQWLTDLGIEQRELAAVAQVTESYILCGKKTQTPLFPFSYGTCLPRDVSS